MKPIEEYVVSIPDFPEQGVIFRDVTSVLQDAEGLHLPLAVEYFEGYFGRPLLDGEHDEPAASGEGYFRGPFVGMRERYGRFCCRSPREKEGRGGCCDKKSCRFHGCLWVVLYGKRCLSGYVSGASHVHRLRDTPSLPSCAERQTGAEKQKCQAVAIRSLTFFVPGAGIEPARPLLATGF